MRSQFNLTQIVLLTLETATIYSSTVFPNYLNLCTSGSSFLQTVVYCFLLQ